MNNELTPTNARKHCEEAILGLLLASPDIFPDVDERITADHFSNEDNRKFYEFIKNCADSEKGWDFEIFLDQFPERDQDWAMSIMEMGRFENLNDYIERVRLKHIARQLFKESSKGADVDVDKIKGHVEDFFTQDKIKEDLITDDIFNDALEVMTSDKPMIEIPISYPDLNFRIGGLVKGDLYVVAGRPGNSKSMLLSNLILRPLNDGKKVLMVDYEMSPVRMIQRLTSIQNDMPLYWNKRVDVDGRTLTNDKLEHCKKLLNKTRDNIKDNLFIAKMQTLASIEAKIIKHRPEVVTIDTLQAFAQDQTQGKNETEAAHISGICRRLRNLAEKYNICIIICSQLNIRDDSIVPNKGHMKSSGGIEEAASVILCVRNRELAYPDDEGERGCYDVSIAKNRNGQESLRLMYNNMSTGKISEGQVTPSIAERISL